VRKSVFSNPSEEPNIRPTNIELRTRGNEVEYYRASLERAATSSDDSFGDMDELMFDKPARTPPQRKGQPVRPNRGTSTSKQKASVTSPPPVQDQTFGMRSSGQNEKLKSSINGSKNYFDRVKDSFERKVEEGFGTDQEITQYKVTNEKSDKRAYDKDKAKGASPLTEKLISYRIEADEYARWQEDEVQKQRQREQRKEAHLQVREPRELSFLERQQKFEMDRDARASQRKAEKEFREAHEFDFQPKSLTKSAARTRSLDQFLRDQQSF
jgi:hypothetical protein